MKRLGKASSTYTFGQKYRIREERYDSHLDSDYMGLFETSMLEDGVGVLSNYLKTVKAPNLYYTTKSVEPAGQLQPMTQVEIGCLFVVTGRVILCRKLDSQ